MPTTREKLEKNRDHLAKKLNLTNRMALPRLEKIVVSTGVGKVKDKKRMEMIAGRLGQITGQKAAARGAKKSVASFKSRQGDVVGYVVTLRGKRMWGFFDKLLNVAIPRIRDFRGFDAKIVDERGGLTIGLREHTIFPETADEELKDVFGLAVTLVSTAATREQALVFFQTLGFPFKK